MMNARAFLRYLIFVTERLYEQVNHNDAVNYYGQVVDLKYFYKVF